MFRKRLLGAMLLACAAVIPSAVLSQTWTNNSDGSHTEQVVSRPTSTPVISFQQTCTTSAAALTSATYTNGYVITALSSNTGNVYVGGSTVAPSTGYPLSPGQSISYGAANSNQAYMICTNTTDKVAVTGN